MIRLMEKLKINKSVLIIMLTYLMFCLISSIYMFAILKIRNGLMALFFMLFVIILIIGSKLFRFHLSPIFSGLVLLLCVGGLSGTIYEMYMILPIFDDVLHGLSGFIFACLGFSLMQHFIGEEKNTKNYIGCIFLSISLSLAIATIWELFEFMTTLVGIDMLGDTIITGFDSYLLAGSHSEVVSIEGITKTIIYYGDGLSITIDGYLDIGIIDTVTDMFVCVIGTLIFVIISGIGYFKCPKFIDLLVPSVY